jgi:hypothetical protein
VRRGRNSNAVPSSDSIPASPRPPRFCQSELECRHAHSLWVAASTQLRMAGRTRPFHQKGPLHRRHSANPTSVRFDAFTRCYHLTNTTLTSSHYFRRSNKTCPDKTKFSRSEVQPYSLRLVFLRHIRFTAKSGAPVGSFCQSRLCSSARRIPQNRAVLASAPFGSAPLRRLTAPPCAPSSPFMKRMFFSGPPRPEF